MKPNIRFFEKFNKIDNLFARMTKQNREKTQITEMRGTKM